MTLQWRDQVKELLERALELPSAERPMFLHRESNDQEVRLEVESLLAEEGNEGPWPEAPLVRSRVRNGTSLGFLKGQRIGPYKVIETLGEGGMGKVALAVREDDFEKRVALKVVSADRLDDDLVRRFHNERQILARLEHPNISRILDGGTTDDGLPFFAMELIEGVPIDRYCETRDLTLEERLKLFLGVCSALEHAHRNLVVHRDLKPSNILVTPAGVPKVLDFGIARLLDPEEGSRELTGQGVAPMTLRYASPEQILNGPITTATDVYTLGLLFYLLLTGHHPFEQEGKSDLQLAEAIRDTDAPKPSSAVEEPQRRRLRGDLDCIIAKALRKEPLERYGSVEALADDIHRFLDGRSVLARQGNWGYHTSKLMRRHWLPVTAATLLMLLSISFGMTSTFLWQKAEALRLQAEQERTRAVKEEARAVDARQESEEVLSFMKSLFRSTKIRGVRNKKEVTALELLAKGELLIEGRDDPTIQAELLGTIGQVYIDMGLFQSALVPRQRAVDILEQQRVGGPPLAKALHNLASWFYRSGDRDRAEALYRRSLAIKLEIDDDDVVDVAKTLSSLAGIAMQRGSYDKAERLYQRALNLRSQQYGDNHLSVAATLRGLGMLYYLRSDFEQAEPLVRRALEIREQRYGPHNTRVATALSSLGRVHHAQGNLIAAEESYQRAFKIRIDQFPEDHLHLAASRIDLARLALDLDRPVEAEGLVRTALRILQKHLGSDSWEVAEAQSVLGDSLVLQGHLAAGIPLLLQGYETLARTRGQDAYYTQEALRRRDRTKVLTAGGSE
jgi:serine/threonine-protein kinase